ncbi:hypothetical protein KI387_023858, partial [Taxus chinensis]
IGAWARARSVEEARAGENMVSAHMDVSVHVRETEKGRSRIASRKIEDLDNFGQDAKYRRGAEEQYIKEDVIVLPVQINGKTRGKLQIPVGSGEVEAFAAVIQDKHFEKYLSGKSIRKKIYVPGRILNIIVEPKK